MKRILAVLLTIVAVCIAGSRLNRAKTGTAGLWRMNPHKVPRSVVIGGIPQDIGTVRHTLPNAKFHPSAETRPPIERRPFASRLRTITDGAMSVNRAESSEEAPR